jgi:hypothetical protein
MFVIIDGLLMHNQSRDIIGRNSTFGGKKYNFFALSIARILP